MGASLRLASRHRSQRLLRAGQSRCSSSSAREEADGDGAGSDLPAGAGGKADGRFFSGCSRVPEGFSKPGEPQHVEKSVPNPQPVAECCSPASGEARR